MRVETSLPADTFPLAVILERAEESHQADTFLREATSLLAVMYRQVGIYLQEDTCLPVGISILADKLQAEDI